MKTMLNVKVTRLQPVVSQNANKLRAIAHCDDDLSTFETYKSSDTYSADEFNDICNYTLAELLLDEEK